MAGKAFCQVLLHEVNDCSWDLATQTVTSPHAQSEMAVVADFENQDWVRDIIQATSNPSKEKANVDPNIAFPFEDDFLVGTIHDTNTRTKKSNTKQAASDKSNDEGVIEILDNRTT